jgi:hypothetical protein
MKLMKYLSSKGEDGEKYYTSILVMTSNDIGDLQSKAHDLFDQMGFNSPYIWIGRRAIPGGKEIKSKKYWAINLSEDVSFVIED